MRNPFPRMMRFAVIVFAVLTAVLAGIDWFSPNGAVRAAAITSGTTCYHFTMRLLVGTLMPPVRGTARWFRPWKWEAPLYRFLRVKYWKKHLPTYDPRQLSLRDYSAEKIVRNMCGAEVIHEVIMVCSFLPLLMVPLFGEFWVFFITSLLSALFDSLFVIAQRYNRPRMERLAHKRQK